MKLTASNLVNFISRLPKNQQYSYIAKTNHGQIVIDGISKPEGPIHVRRYDPTGGEGPRSNPPKPISSEMLWRVANYIRPNIPFNIDRILGSSYNTRSLLESLLAHTPQFYYCYPGRIERCSDKERIKRGHKHLIWCPEEPHANGVLIEKDVEIAISELPSADAVYESVTLIGTGNAKAQLENIEVKRRHAQIQVALYMIGINLGYRTWIARNDKSIMYRHKRICEYPEVIADLRQEKLLQAYDDAAKAALLIDCIWFKNGRLMPAVMEVEHSTGIRSGLTRMQNFKDRFPPFDTRWVIVAPDEDRKRVFAACSRPQFQKMKPRYFPYSAVEELYALCSRRKLRGVTEDFLDCFMEPTLTA